MRKTYAKSMAERSINLTPEIQMELREKVNDELRAGEQIRWIEQPIPRFFTRPATVLFLFGLFVSSCMVLAKWSSMQSSRHQAPGIEESLGLCLFGLIGLAMLSAPIWAYRRAFKIVYVITDRRAIIFTWGWLGKIQSFTPDQLKKTYRKEKDDGTGDVVLEKEVVFDPNIMGNGKGATYNEVGFLRVRDARKVEQMVKDLCEKGGTIVV